MGTRHRFIYAIALHDLGQPQKAIVQLQALLRSVPRNQEVLATCRTETLTGTI